MEKLWTVMDVLSPYFSEEKKATVRKLKVLLFILKEEISDKPSCEAMLGITAGAAIGGIFSQLEREDGLIETYTKGKRTACSLTIKGKALRQQVEEILRQ